MAQESSTIENNTMSLKETAQKETAQKETKKKQRSKKIVEEPELCSICASKYTPIIRKKIICKFCSKDTCSKCIEQYLTSRHEDAHCLHCRVNYNDTMLNEICTKTYLQQTYFRHRQEVLMNRERANLPGLQDEAILLRNRRERNVKLQELCKEIKEIKEIKNRLSNEYANLYVECNRNYRELKENGELQEVQNRLNAYQEQRIQNHTLFRNKRDEYRKLRWSLYRENRNNNNDSDDDEEEKKEENKEESKEEKRKFIRRCMRTDCQGFLSTAWKCGICEWYSCSKCFVVKGKDHDTLHECKKEDIETAEMIKKDSKPCPKCGEFINKSSGCSQMFCISCKTPWDWNTGKIVTHGALHNPHYYEWMNRNGGGMPRNPADVPCGGYPNMWELRRIHTVVPESIAALFYGFHRISMEIQDITTRNYRRHMDENNTNQINVRFLLRDYDEKYWGRQLAINEKKRKYDAEIQEIFTAFRMVAVELINRVQHYRDETVDAFTLLSSKRAEKIILDLNVEIQELIQMINSALRNVSISYSYSVPQITTNTTYNDITYYIIRNHNFANDLRKERKSKQTVACNDNNDDEKEFNNEDDIVFEAEEDEKNNNEDADSVAESDNETENTVSITHDTTNTLMDQDQDLQRAIEQSYKTLNKPL